MDNSKKPVENAIVSAIPGELSVISSGSGPGEAIIDQINRQFVPHVLVVQKGAYVSFPNSDNIKHHVYSFSKAKRFEIKLYEKMPKEKILFDRTGTVALGCNIHDWMLGYIYVVDTPYFSKSDKEGRFHLKGVPPGNYSIKIWHPRIKGKPGKYERSLHISTEKELVLDYKLKLKRKRIRKVRSY